MSSDPILLVKLAGIIFPTIIVEAVDISVFPYTFKLPVRAVCPATVADPVTDKLPLALISPLM